jgi:hypothetical protein
MLLTNFIVGTFLCFLNHFASSAAVSTLTNLGDIQAELTNMSAGELSVPRSLLTTHTPAT